MIYQYLLSTSVVAQAIKYLPAMQETRGSTPGLGRSPGEGNGNPLQYSYLGIPMDRGAWQATVPGVPSGDPGVSGDFWGSQVGCQGPFHPSRRNRGLPLRRRPGQGPLLAQLCLTLRNPIDGSPPGSSVPGILQGRTLEWVAISFSRSLALLPL